MQLLKAINVTRNQLLAERVKLANNFFTRLRGLLLSQSLPTGQGLLLMPCKSIHSIGMGYPIDAIFLNEELIVVAVEHNFQAWQISTVHWQAHSCLELPAGTIVKTGTLSGDQLSLENLVQTKKC